MESFEEMYDIICRVCLSYGNSENMVNLTEKSSSDGLSCYGKAVAIFTNIQYSDKNLPDKMCVNCLFRLKQAIIFKKTCENSDQKLLELAKKFDSSKPDFKQKLCDFVMFSKFFPHQNATTSSKKSSSDIILEKLEEYHDNFVKNEPSDNMVAENDFEDLFSLEYREDEEISLKTDPEDLDCDQILDEMEKVIDMPPENLNTYRKKYIKNAVYKNTPIRKTWRRHKKKTSVKTSNDLQCKICNKTLSNLTSYTVHMDRHSGGRFICEQCGKKYPTKAELQYHLASSHNIGPQHVCKICGIKVPKKHELMEHERIHTGERPYACDKCGLTFRRRYIWSKHQLCHMEKNLQCPQCPKKFSEKRNVLDHINSVHERMFVFACSQCEVTYAKSSTVRKHMVEKHGMAKEMQGKIKRINLSKCSLSSISQV